MPRVVVSREKRDQIHFDTHDMRPGDAVRFFHQPQIGLKHSTNLWVPGQLAVDQDVAVFSLALRLLGVPRDEEDVLLDEFLITPELGMRPQIDIPGTVCSAFRYIAEDLEADPTQDPLAFTPGYVFKAPIIIPVRQNINCTVYRDHAGADRSLRVRVQLFTMHVRTRG